MKKQLILLFWLVATSISAQTIDTLLMNEIPIIKDNVFRQRQEIDELTKKLITNQTRELLKIS